MAGLRGLTEKQEQDASRIIRDTRTMGQRINEFFHNPTAVGAVLISIGVMSIIFPVAADLALLSGSIIFLICRYQKTQLPVKMPMTSGLMDYNDLVPGTRRPKKAGGIYFLGNDIETDQELWFSNEDMRTHVLIFGSTGSGKTEALISIAYNALIQNSGFIYVDGKGDNALFAKIFSMVRYMGREDDLLLINFMTGARDIIGPQKTRLSNTMNPFARGSSSMLAQLVISLMDSGSSSSDGDMWKGRAIAFVESLMRVLVAMRDAGHILLDANSIRNYFHLEKLESIVLDKLFVREGQEPINLQSYPSNVLEPITNYVLNLPGYNKAKKGKQVSQVLEQHGFITMQLVRVFTSLADTYGHILRTELAEVDFHDIVLNRRILVALLPAMEKSPDELSQLGKIIIATLKAMLASGLGDEVEGTYKRLIASKATNAKTPYLCILDEYGYYAVEGFAVVPAQARSLGFSVIFAGQDLPAFQKASEEEAKSIGANTNIKICMKLEDPLETWEFFQKTAGEAYVTHVESFQTNARSVTNQYMDTQSAKIEKRQRVELLDLKEQSVGEGHLFFRSKIIRYRVFYAAPKSVKSMRLNHCLKVREPLDRHIKRFGNAIERFDQFRKGDGFSLAEKISDLVDGLMVELNNFADKNTTPFETAALALNSLVSNKKELAPVAIQSLPAGEINVFNISALTPELEAVLIDTEANNLTAPMLDFNSAFDSVSFLQRAVSNNNEDESYAVADNVLKDMRLSTHYPPDQRNVPKMKDMTQLTKQLIEAIRLRKQADSGSK